MVEQRMYCRCGATLEVNGKAGPGGRRVEWLREHRPHGLGTRAQAERARAEKARMEREQARAGGTR